MTTPTPTAQSSASADAEVMAQFVRGSEQPVDRSDLLGIYRNDRVFHARVEAFARHIANELVERNTEHLRIDLADAQDKLLEAEQQRDTALRQLAQAIEILTDIQARAREVVA